MKIRPLIDFWAWRSPDRVQLAFLLLYLIGVVHLSFFSLSDRDPVEARHWLLSVWLSLLLPVWIVDGEMNRRRSIRLLVWPRSDLRGVIAAYILGRATRSVALAVVVALCTLNTKLLSDGQASWILAACGALGIFATSFVMFWNVVVGVKSVYPAIYAAAAALLWVLSRLADSRVAVEIAQTLFMPVWLLDPVSAAQSIGEPFHVVQVCSASATWFAASWLVLRRSYR